MIAEIAALVSTYGGLAVIAAVLLLIAASVLEVSKIKVNPWSSLGQAIGKRINGQVLQELETVKANQAANQQKLDEHIKADDEREADGWRASILHFNLELIRNTRHTREDFVEILLVIDKYQAYCRNHKDYSNNRAVHAIANIGRVYDERLEKHDFEKE